MPIYEFQCRQCRHIYEELVLSGHSADMQCPKCHCKKVSRLISRTGSVKKRGTGADGASSASCGSGGFS